MNVDLDGVPIRMSISKPNLVAYVQILLGVTGHQVMAHGMHRGLLFEDLTSLFVPIKTCNNLAQGSTRHQRRWALGSLALVQLYGFKEPTKLPKLSKLPCFKGTILDHLSTSNIFSHSYLARHAPYSLEALRSDVV